jgi:hypothetical protein
VLSLKRRKDEYHERQHSGQEREQPVGIGAMQLVRFSRRLYSHRSCSNREASTPWEGPLALAAVNSMMIGVVLVI